MGRTTVCYRPIPKVTVWVLDLKSSHGYAWPSMDHGTGSALVVGEDCSILFTPFSVPPRAQAITVAVPGLHPLIDVTRSAVE